MCFSATASFAASGGLAAIGGASLRASERKNRVLAAIPLLFAVQQLLEGIQWLSVRPSLLSSVAGYGFLFFAFGVWPAYMPLAVFFLDEKKRGLMKWFVALGLATATYLLGVLLSQPLVIAVANKSIDYQVHVPFLPAAALAYFLAGCGAPILSSKPALRWFGVALFSAAVLAAVVSYITFESVWCFFAALLSSWVFFYVRKRDASESS